MASCLGAARAWQQTTSANNHVALKLSVNAQSQMPGDHVCDDLHDDRVIHSHGTLLAFLAENTVRTSLLACELLYPPVRLCGFATGSQFGEKQTATRQQLAPRRTYNLPSSISIQDARQSRNFPASNGAGPFVWLYQSVSASLSKGISSS